MNTLKKEIKMSIRNIFFIFPSAILIIISLIYTYESVKTYTDYYKVVNFNEILQQNPLTQTLSVYTLWLGGPKLENNMSSKILFILIIFFAVLPYSWSYCAERRRAKKAKENFITNISYRITKYATIFFSSGLIAAIPLMTNLIFTFLFIPAIKPDPVYDIYYREFSNSLLGDIFYAYPIFYEIIYILIFFVFCGLIGCVGYAFALLFKNEILTVLSVPFLILITHFLKEKATSFINGDISPISYLNIADVMLRNYRVMFIEMLLMFAFSLTITLIKKDNNNISEEKR